MILDGQSIVDKSIVAFNDEYPLINTDSQIQPNGVDLRLNRIYSISGMASVPKDGKVNSTGFTVFEIEPKDGWFDLDPRMGKVFLVDFLETVNMHDGFSADLITRSSLVRAGIDVQSGLWDTGFNGTLGCTIRLWNGIKIEWGAKLCQIRVMKSEFNGKRYEGRYQGTNSQTAITT